MSDKHPNPPPTAGTGPRQQKRSRVSIRWRRTIGSGAPRRNLPLPACEPTAPGSLKAPDTHNSKLDSWRRNAKGGRFSADHQPGRGALLTIRIRCSAGSRGPPLLEDFILREKITHFDHERIPERISLMPAALPPTATSSPTKAWLR